MSIRSRFTPSPVARGAAVARRSVRPAAGSTPESDGWSPRLLAPSLCRLSGLLFLAAVAATGVSVRAEEPQPAPKVDSPPPPPPQLVAEGQILDSVGGGVSGVEVVARKVSKEGAEGEVIARTTTNELGDYRLVSEQPYAGSVVVHIAPPNYLPISHRFECGPGKPPPFLADELAGSLTLVGRVLESVHSKPLAGAKVQLDAMYRTWHAVTAEDGRFEIKQVPPGRGVLAVTAEGYGREQHTVESLAAAGNVELVLKPERTARLLVVDDLNQPLAGVTIECYDQESNDFRMLVTDAKGRGEIRGLNFDIRELGARLTHRAHVSSLWFDRRLEFPSTAASSEHTLIMQRAGSVSGRVLDAATDRPLQGARVLIGDVISDFVPTAYTDDAGRFMIEGAAPGRCRLTVHRTDYAPQTVELDVKIGETASRDFRLTPGVVLKGIVRFDDGKPAAGALVETGEWHGGQTLGLRAMLGEKGEFELPNVPGEELEIIVSYRGGAPVTTKARPGESGPIEIVIPAAPADAAGPAPKPKQGDPAPDLKLQLLDGRTVGLDTFKGSVVLVHFWATWCPGCVAEIPAMVALQSKLSGRKNVVILSLSLDQERAKAERFVADRKMTWLHAIGEAGGAMAAADAFGVHAIPTNFVLDGEGRVIEHDLHGSALEAKLVALSTKDEKK